MSRHRRLTPTEFLELVGNAFAADDMGWPPGPHSAPMCLVDLRGDQPGPGHRPTAIPEPDALRTAVADWPVVIIGMVDTATEPGHPLVEACDTLIGPHATLPSADFISKAAVVQTTLSPGESNHRGPTGSQIDRLESAILASPTASVALAELLRFSSRLPVLDAIRAESQAYSLLQSGPTFTRWRQQRSQLKRPRLPEPTTPAVTATRPPTAPATLRLQLNRPEVHNAFSIAVRDALAEALRLASMDPSITRVEISGRGSSFCSGGDLREFGTFDDPATAHRARMIRHPGRWMHQAAATSTVVTHIHGYAIGAGIEVPAFADRLIADSHTEIWLPELKMGLLPGAGGTVSLPRRIGRHRTMFMALTGQRISGPEALAWGLVDEIGRPPPATTM